MGASRPRGDLPQESNYPQRRRGILPWLLVLGALLLLALLLFGLVRACGTPGSEDEGAGSQGGDTTQEQEQASGGDTVTGNAAGDGQTAGEEGDNDAGEAAAAAGIAGARGAGAAAQLQDAQGNPVGTASFAEDPNGSTVTVDLQRGQQAVTPGEHAIHIHERGDITPDFEAAGEHFNPTDAQHGFDNTEGPHAGDLENIVVNEDGSASYEATSGLTTLNVGANSLLDSDGSALVIHESADDYRTDPAGDSGERVAAGIIREAATGEATVAAETTNGPLPESGGLAIGSSVLLPAAALLLGSGILGYAVVRRRR
jgi:superoxide dismutase, Cu-Zn family